MAQHDAEAHAKLDRILAAQDQHTTKFDDIETVLGQVIQAVRSLAGSFGLLREAVLQLAEAAQMDGGGDELSAALKGILDELGKQTSHMAVIGLGLERLPAIMEDTAIAAAEMATGGGAQPRGRA